VRSDEFQRRHRWAGFPLAVCYKFVDDQGYYLAALLTYYGFLSLFPLLLLLVTGLGFVMQDNSSLQQQVLHSALTDFPVLGQQLMSNVHSLHGNVSAVAFGAAGAVYGALGVAGAGQAVLNKIWAVPRVRRPNLLGFYVRGLLMLATLGLGVLLTTALTAVTTVASDLFANDVLGALLANLGALVVNLLLFLLAFRVLTARDIAPRQLLPGAVVSTLLWQGLQIGGTYLLEHELRGSSATYGAFGVVIGLIVWLYLGATVAVLGAEINAVRVLRLWPRSLLTPFVADAPLTPADRTAYAEYARTEQLVEQADIRVRFPRRTKEKKNGPADG
jgi:YihY family inner membrane protein